MSQEKLYYKGGLASHGHTPIYKMHKYFARRPHNVFYSLIEHYSQKGDIIYDPFGGGGVTLVEGLTGNRRIISSDVNPIASFIQYCQALSVSPIKFLEIAEEINKKVQNQFGQSLHTQCMKCNSSAHVRWYEHAYTVSCPSCSTLTDLRNENMTKSETGKQKPGQYTCTHCKKSFPAVNVPRNGSIILNVRYNCSFCGSNDSKMPDEKDIENFLFFIENEKGLINSLKLDIPDEEIPDYWDRQQEDCLHRKGIKRFKDFFTVRNQIISAFYFSSLETYKGVIDEDLYLFILFNISSLLRYTNNMNLSTSSWMDGRPVAWAKHAYWLPNQFIEVNPCEYFENRIKAALSGLKDQRNRFTKKKSTINTGSFFSKNKDYCIVCIDSASIDLPNNSVDVIITDPPYGSNVQYSELCAFWYVWIKDKIPFNSENFFFTNEAVAHRKTKIKSYSKTFESYQNKLKDIFAKCYEVLKPEGYMVFTFNNKNIKAWFSLVKAAIDSGFFLAPEGIVYQEPIDAYRDTAHQRFNGTPQGDFIYSFKKTGFKIDLNNIPTSIDECIDSTIQDFIKLNEPFSFDEFMVKLYAKSTFLFIQMILNGEKEEAVLTSLASELIVKKLNSDSRIAATSNLWKPKKILNVHEFS